MKNFKRVIAVLLTLVIVSGSFVCFAVDSEKQHYNYEKVLLLGDSEASGYTDFTYKNTEFIRIDDSYAAYVADHFGAELIPMACPGFRTLELRYMLDETYRPVDRYLFNAIPNSPTHEIIARIPDMIKAVEESDLIIIGIGGNDWGAYVGWVMADVELENKLPEEYRAALRKFLTDATVEDDVIEKIIELADTFNALDELMVAIPEALKYGFENLRINWNCIVEKIYELNPDVTLAVIGMFPTTLKTAPGAPDVVLEYDPTALAVEQMIIDYGNKHMIENQAKYGYIYVDTTGTIVEDAHPTVVGHRFIADRILEELPDARFVYTDDVSIRNANYKAIEYVTLNNIMPGTSETTFSPDEPMTKAIMSQAINKITGNYKITDSTDAVSSFDIAIATFTGTKMNSITTFFKAIKFAVDIIVSGDNNITRGEAAGILYSYIQNFVK